MDSPAKRTSTEHRRSSFIARARKSFFRSKGQRGADIETIRGNTGADFEEKGKIARGSSDSVGCFCFGSGDDKEKNKERILLIKGPFCFIYSVDNPKSPKYAIALQSLQAESKKDSTTVYLKKSLGDIEYEIHFNDCVIAQKFVKVVHDQSKSAQCAEIRKQLGHGHLLNRHASIRYAEEIACKKLCDQPPAPITTKDVLDNMPIGAV